MNTADRVANELLRKAAEDASKKLKEMHDHVQALWSEANSIPSGCGGTPFRGSARSAEARLRKTVKEFVKRYGQEALDKLQLRYGLRD